MTIVYLFASLILLSVLIAWYSYRTAFIPRKSARKMIMPFRRVRNTKKSGSECCRSSARWMKFLMKL